MKKVIILLLVLLVMSCNYLTDPAIMKYFKQNLIDPGSLQVINWREKSPLFDSKINLDFYRRTVKFRSKNSFGGYVIGEWRFSVIDREAYLREEIE